MPRVLLTTGPKNTALATARALRNSLSGLSLTALSRAPHGPAVHADVFDTVWTVPSWDNHDPNAHAEDRGWHRLPRGNGRVLGRLCMEADVLGRRRQVSPLSPGNTIVVCDAGAYDAGMTYPFGQGRAAT